MYNPATSIFAGMDDAALDAAIAGAQQAYIAVLTGAKGVSFSYTQGDGSKSVTYTEANPAALVMLIKQLQAQRGIVPRARRPIRPFF